jgi:Uma2 family endonuclease
MSRMERPGPLHDAGEPDPYRYGWKEEVVHHPDGRAEPVNTPLTLEDLLHPEPNYKIMNGYRHAVEVNYLWVVIRNHLSPTAHALVLSDTGVYWPEPGLRHHCPDITVLFSVQEVDRPWPSFHVAEEGVRPTLIIEVASPLHRQNDVVTKLDQYHQAGVPWYIIVDRIQNEGPPTLLGYRNTPDGYVEFPPDEQGRLHLEPLGLKIGVSGDRVALYDAETGEELGDYDDLKKKLIEALQGRQAAEREKQAADERAALAEREKKAADEQRLTAEREKQEAEREKQAADERAALAERERQAAEEQRLAAEREKRAADERVALAEKEKQAADERTALAEREKQAAERDRAAEAEARKRAEDQLAALMQQLADLQRQQPGNPDPGQP